MCSVLSLVFPTNARKPTALNFFCIPHLNLLFFSIVCRGRLQSCTCDAWQKCVWQQTTEQKSLQSQRESAVLSWKFGGIVYMWTCLFSYLKMTIEIVDSRTVSNSVGPHQYSVDTGGRHHRQTNLSMIEAHTAVCMQRVVKRMPVTHQCIMLALFQFVLKFATPVWPILWLL